MQKDKLVKFIEKYNLKEIVETTKIEVKDNKIKTKFVDDLKALKGDVSYNNFDSEDVEFGVYNTKLIKTFLSILENDMNIEFNKSNDFVESIIFKDSKKEIKYLPCDLSVIPEPPPFKELPKEFSIECEITDDFIDNFIKSESAIEDSDFFVIKLNESRNVYEIIFGYLSSTDTNTIKFDIDLEVKEEDKVEILKFNSKYVREILSSNKDMEDRKLKIVSGGLMIFNFDSEEYNSNYYLKANINN